MAEIKKNFTLPVCFCFWICLKSFWSELIWLGMKATASMHMKGRQLKNFKLRLY